MAPIDSMNLAPPERRQTSVISRRSFIATTALSAAAARRSQAAGRGTRLDHKPVELDDPLTGRASERLTPLEGRWRLPSDAQRFLSKKNDFLLLISEVSGAPQIHHCDLRRGRLTQLTAAPDLLAGTAALDPRDRTFYYATPQRLLEGSARSGGDRAVAQAEEGWRFSGEFAVASNGEALAAVEVMEDDWREDPAELFAARPSSRIRLFPIDGAGGPRVLTETKHWLSRPQFRPAGRDLLYAQEGPWGEVDGRIRIVGADGSVRNVLPRVGEEQIGAEHWLASGTGVRFVHHPGPGYRGASVREFDLASGEIREISKCTAFGAMQSNADGGAIAGASRRPSGPYIFILFTRLGREITLAEHSVADWSRTNPAPALSANSQWVYFASESEGSPAVYRMKLEDLVSET